MPVSVRPTGVICNNFVYSDKSNVWGKLKQFLFETDTGRTDVIFVSGAASGLEPNQWQYDEDPDAYHYTGGLIDGISKALIKGNANWSGRSLYATPIFLGWQTHVVPGFDRFNSATWNNPNTTGVGNYLSGCSTFYNNILFYNNTTLGKKSTGFIHAEVTTDSPVVSGLYSFDNIAEEVNLNSSFPTLWHSNAFPTGSYSSNIRSYETSILRSFLSGGVEADKPTFINPNQVNLLHSSLISFTPNQPTRYWKAEALYTIQAQDFWYIGIGFLDPTTNLITEIFPDAQTHGYVPNGITVGTSRQTIETSFASQLTLTKTMTTLSECCGPLIITSPLTEQTVQTTGASLYWGTLNPSQLKPEAASYVLGTHSGKQIVVRKITTTDLFTFLNFNIAPNKAAITNETAWNNFDAINLENNTYLVKKIFPTANYRTMPSNSVEAQKTFIDRNWYKVYGLATASNPAVATGQAGVPFLITYGIRNPIPCFNSFTPYNSYNTFRSAGTPIPIVGNKVNGLALTLNTMGAHGFFYLNQLDTPALIDPTTTIDKDRGIIIKPHLGLFFDLISVVDNLHTPIVRTLTEQERLSKLGIFSSNFFTYVVNAVTPKQYLNEPGIFNPTSNVVLTGHYQAAKNQPLTTIAAGDVRNLPVGTLVSNLESRRGFNIHTIAKNYNLAAINPTHTARELQFGFVGKGTNDTAKGNLVVTSHYGIDTNNQHGIAFTIFDKTYLSRTGDNGYRCSDNDTTMQAGIAEIFRQIRNRQLNNGSIQSKCKVVVFVEIGVWELADLAATYNGVGAWDYLVDLTTLNSSRIPPLDRNSIVFLIAQSAINLGISRDEVVFVFYTPGFVSKSDLPGYGTAHGTNFNSTASIELFLQNINSRLSYIRASEIFINNILSESGYYNPSPPSPYDALTNPAARNSCYINLGQIPSISVPLNAMAVNDDWYARNTSEDPPEFTLLSEKGALAVGALLVEHIRTNVATVNFVPPWIPPFTKILNYTTDPVSGAPLEFLTISTDRLDIEPYLVELDAKCDQGNIQAKRTLSRYKTKILQ
jgi:hypothetical protein